MRLLLEAGAGPDFKSQHGHTPLMCLTMDSERADAEVLQSKTEADREACAELLLQFNATVSLKSLDGETALSLAVHHELVRAYGPPRVLRCSSL